MQSYPNLRDDFDARPVDSTQLQGTSQRLTAVALIGSQLEPFAELADQKRREFSRSAERRANPNPYSSGKIETLESTRETPDVLYVGLTQNCLLLFKPITVPAFSCRVSSLRTKLRR